MSSEEEFVLDLNTSRESLLDDDLCYGDFIVIDDISENSDVKDFETKDVSVVLLENEHTKSGDLSEGKVVRNVKATMIPDSFEAWVANSLVQDKDNTSTEAVQVQDEQNNGFSTTGVPRKIAPPKTLITIQETVTAFGVKRSLHNHTAPKRTIKKKRTGSDCPWCHEKVDQLGRHVRQEHLPWYFSPETGCWRCFEQEGTVTYLRCKHLLKNCSSGGFNTTFKLGEWCSLMGGFLDFFVKEAGCLSPEDLLEWAVRNDLTHTHPSVDVTVVRTALFTYLATALHLPSLEEFTMSPPNSPVCLLQWEVIHNMYNFLNLNIDLRTITQHRDKVTLIGPLFIDAHMHLHRTLERMRLTELPRGDMVCPDHLGEQLVAVIDNRVFPDEWATWKSALDDARVSFSFGCHPGVGKTPEEAGIEALCSHTRCVAIGECGIDETYNIPIERQVYILRQHAILAGKLLKPIVLHLRGKTDEEDVYDLALQTLQVILPRTHKIYIHSFCGNSELSGKWLRVFPNTLFGISGLWWRNRRLSAQITSLPLEKMALETDSPYLPSPGNKFQTPHMICRIASALGRRRNLPDEIVMEIGRRNVQKFFW